MQPQDPTDPGAPPPGLRLVDDGAPPTDDAPPHTDDDAPGGAPRGRGRRRRPIHGGPAAHDPIAASPWSLRVIGRDPRRYALLDARGETPIACTATLMSRSRTLRAYVEAHGRVPIGLPESADWLATVDQWLASAEVVEVDATETTGGARAEAVADAIGHMPRAETLDDLERAVVVVIDETEHVRLGHVDRAVADRLSSRLSSADLGSILRDQGWRPQPDTPIAGRRLTVWRRPIDREEGTR